MCYGHLSRRGILLRPFLVFHVRHYCLCCILLRYKEAELPRVTVQKPDGLFGHPGHYDTAFGLLGHFDLETVLDSIVFHGSTSIVSSVIPVVARRITRDPGRENQVRQ
jgi:hypothetical protein